MINNAALAIVYKTLKGFNIQNVTTLSRSPNSNEPVCCQLCPFEPRLGAPFADMKELCSRPEVKPAVRTASLLVTTNGVTTLNRRASLVNDGRNVVGCCRRLCGHNGRLPLAPSVYPTDRTSLKETACLVKISLEIAITCTDAKLNVGAVHELFRLGLMFITITTVSSKYSVGRH